MPKQEVWSSEDLRKHMAAKTKKEDKKKKAKTRSYPIDKARYAIGVDVGIVSGFSVYHRGEKRLVIVESCKLFQLFERLRAWGNNNDVYVYIENPNTYVAFNTSQNESKKQRAGGVKQTYKHIIELLEHEKIPYCPTSVIGGVKKLDSETFKSYTGWAGTTNEHSRDAAMIVFKRDLK